MDLDSEDLGFNRKVLTMENMLAKEEYLVVLVLRKIKLLRKIVAMN